MSAVPIVDTTTQDCLTDEQARAFREQGLIVLRGLLRGEELAAMRAETQALVDRANAERVADPDYKYKPHELTGETVPFRVEYVIEKTLAGKALLGHPFILRSVEQLQGPNFVPTWDSMVFKNAGAGAAITWHRDGGADCFDPGYPIFNVDFYLDAADLANCLWGIPGSNHWTREEANERIAELTNGGFRTAGAEPLEMAAGDVLFHNILTLHGSPAGQAPQRRVVYYEFRPAEVESVRGPHRQEYIPVKQRVLLACLRDRARSGYANGEEPFAYRPTADFPAPDFSPDDELETYRYPHEEWWRGQR